MILLDHPCRKAVIYKINFKPGIIMIRIFFVKLLCLTVICSYGQREDLDAYEPAPKIIPASPEAAAMRRFGDPSIDLFKGQPNISIPIYTLKSYKLEVPVSLDYNASGFRVGELASASGLGWNLRFGGMISVEIKGQSDLLPGTRKTPDIKTFSPLVYGTSDYTLAKDIIEKKYDTEPDIFNYVYPGGSGKFVFNNDFTKIYTIPFSNVKIEYNAGQFKIVDESGQTYLYTIQELTKPTENCTLGSPGKREFNDQVSMGWFLTKIVYPGNADSIMLDYEEYSYAYREGRSETRYKYLPSSLCASQSSQFSTQERVCVRSMHYNTFRIKTITTANLNKIRFFYETVRKDIDSQYSFNESAKSLDSIVIENQGSRLKVYKFQYSYFLSGDTTLVAQADRCLYRRLKLSGVEEDNLLNWDFEYVENKKLPYRLSSSQDLLGYCSGSLNSAGSMIPCLEGTNNYPGCSLRDISYSFNQDAFVLKKIAYPTGGSSLFTYEQHQRTEKEMKYDTTYGGFGIDAAPEEIVFDSVTLTMKPGRNQMFIRWDLPCSSDRLEGCSNGFVELPDGQRLSLDNISPQGNITVPFQAGKYRLRIGNYRQFASDAYISLIWIDTVTVITNDVLKLKSGIRLKKTVDSAHFNSPPIVREYTYSNMIDGRNIQLYDPISTRHCYSSPQGNGVYYCDYIRYNGRAVNPYGINNDFQFGYEAVEVTRTSTSVPSSKERYTFFVNDTGIDSVGEYNGIQHFGKMKKKEAFIFDEQAGVYKKHTDEENFYTMRIDENRFWTNVSPGAVDNENFIPGVKVSYEFPEQPQSCGLYTLIAEFMVEPYIVSTFSEHLNKVVSKIYNLNGDSLVITKIFLYDSSAINLPTRISETNSKNELITTILKYPYHYKTLPIYTDMIDRNVYLPVIEKVVKNGNSEMSKEHKNYDFFQNGSFIEIKSIQRSMLGKPLADEMTITAYDDNADIMEFVGKEGIFHSYIRGYNKTYPIASAVNAPVKDIFHTSFEEGDGNSSEGDAKTGRKSKTGGYTKSLTNLTPGTYILSYWQKSGSTWTYTESKIPVTGTTSNISIPSNVQLDELRFYPEKAQMTTYTYDPLIGMTSQCDVNNRITYYEYDSFGRLKTIFDQDKNVIRTMDYQYQQSNNQ